MKRKQFVHTTDCIKSAKTASSEAIKHLHEFHHLIIELQNTASKRTHYVELEPWSNKVHTFINQKLEHYGFENANVEKNRKNPDVSLWWDIYGLVTSIVYSPYLKSTAAYHHSSAFERNRALLGELNVLWDEISIANEDERRMRQRESQ